jgi:hypothetical protein
VNKERTVIQELQTTPMGVIAMIHPKNDDTDTRIGINLFKQVGQLRVLPSLKQLLCLQGHAVAWHCCCIPRICDLSAGCGLQE